MSPSISSVRGAKKLPRKRNPLRPERPRVTTLPVGARLPVDLLQKVEEKIGRKGITFKGLLVILLQAWVEVDV